MVSSEVTEKLRPIQQEISALGISRLLLVGSTAHGFARPDSDVDFVVEFRGAATFLGYMELVELLERHLGCDVDVSTLQSLRPEIAKEVLAGALQVA